jgi:hypothetical protein
MKVWDENWKEKQKFNEKDCLNSFPVHMHILYCMEFEEGYYSQNWEKRSPDLNRNSTEFCNGEQNKLKKKKGKE